ncbi:MAG: efflux RND transporter periplasmic adaptor subunit [Cyanobacteria bacterium HKST-UBA02]|nr:efflux RND transporter periplasmic adaptor subunit [Cyanobacteria bacterium HKST-UBA02]
MFNWVSRFFLAAFSAAVLLAGCSASFPASSGSTGKSIPKAYRPAAGEVVLTPAQEETAGIETVPLSVQPVRGGVLELSSTVESPADATGIIYSPVNGVVIRVLVDVGDRVRKGQVVVYVNSPDISDAQASYLDAQAKLSQTRAQLETIRARIELGRANEVRMTRLRDEGIASTKDVETARSTKVAVQSEEAAAMGSMNAAMAHLQAASVKLKSLGLKEPVSTDVTEGSGGASNMVTASLPIRSPVSGVVVKKEVFPGQSVGPGSTAASSSGTGRPAALMTIADLSKVWVLLEVPQREVSAIKLGDSIDFRTESIPDRQFRGRITKLAESFDPHSRTAQVRAEIINPGGILKPGMLVIASIARQVARASQLGLPTSAIQTMGGRDIVFVRRSPHHYQVRDIRCGARSASSVEVKSGVEPGEEVVTRGAFFLKSESMRESIAGAANDE